MPSRRSSAASGEASEQKLAADPVTAATFLPDGHPLEPGEIFANPKLAATLETVAHGGRDAFYKGPIARAIVADMKKRSGLLDERDFAEHIARTGSIPSPRRYRGYDVYELPPNTQGFVVLEMLNILEGFDVEVDGAQLARSTCTRWSRRNASRLPTARPTSPTRRRFRRPC